MTAAPPLDVPRETLDRLTKYVDLLERWQDKINLVSPTTVAHVWDRHIADSLQLLDLIAPSGKWVDLGSGGGFPGMVIALTAHPARRTVLIESDRRKATFLRTVARETDVPVTIIADRIEAAEPQQADVVTARALAPLVKLLPYLERHRKPDGTALLMKGESWKDEVAQAQKEWRFQFEVFESRTRQGAVVLKIGEFLRD